MKMFLALFSCKRSRHCPDMRIFLYNNELNLLKRKINCFAGNYAILSGVDERADVLSFKVDADDIPVCSMASVEHIRNSLYYVILQ